MLPSVLEQRPTCPPSPLLNLGEWLIWSGCFYSQYRQTNTYWIVIQPYSPYHILTDHLPLNISQMSPKIGWRIFYFFTFYHVLYILKKLSSIIYHICWMKGHCTMYYLPCRLLLAVLFITCHAILYLLCCSFSAVLFITCHAVHFLLCH